VRNRSLRCGIRANPPQDGDMDGAPRSQTVLHIQYSVTQDQMFTGTILCPVNRDQVRSLDYAVHSCFRKIFATTDQSVVEQCMIFFECHHVQDTIRDRKRKFPTQI